MKIKDHKVRQAWLNAYKKELKVLIENGTFTCVTLDKNSKEKIIPIMDDNRVKILENGQLDKLKTRLVVRGDIQRKWFEEYNYSPTASHRSLKLFLANACKHGARVRQLDFVGAFLQAPMRSRVLIKIPEFYGKVFPEFSKYCGTPLLLNKSMYGQTISGKNWYDELDEWLISEGFVRSYYCPAMYVRRNTDGSITKILNYVDDMLYFCTNGNEEKNFERDLGNRFRIELKGQASWYLSVRIKQDKSHNITIDQNRYVQSILRRFLDTAGVPETHRKVQTPLPFDFKSTKEDQAKTEEESKDIQRSYNIDFAACVGCLIYLSYTRFDILYAVNKLAKFTRKPGKPHMNAIIHVLRYLRDNPTLGIKYYSDWEQSPLCNLLKNNGLPTKNELVTFSDSSWQDDIDTSRSTGCYLITYRGGIVDQSSNIPEPVALSSAEAEYNEACLGCMGTAHMKMLLEDLEMQALKDPIPIIVDSKSAHDMGHSFKSTKHTRHILRRYHYVKEGQHAGYHELLWIPSEYQLADIGTKCTTKNELQSRLDYLLVNTADRRKDE